MARPVTHYEALGVDPSVGAEQIHEAYLALALRHHPDVAGGDAERMRAINAAWATLGDPARRASYDAQLRAEAAPGAGARETPPPSTGGIPDLDDLVADLADLADLADDTPIGGVVVLPRWLSLVPAAAFAAALVLFGLGLVMGMAWLLGLALVAFLLSGLLFLAAPFMALLASRRGNR